ncbi:TetR/AcrR family transcriptional regulator [Alkalilacustris brevis]|uniref:TetR/AcrR family transcriptional regulator n=1 Tax=Alkalilacustris brevis TaxID=2026338 RepID=UPI00138FD5B1|nr:TetR/AcrR family transcriptional regulator [Alkalilacustris brevis]
MEPEKRKKLLVEKAVEFFSEEGFEAGTRELARRLGVSQPLIYRYFDSKDDLVNEVYRKVYVSQWNDAWTATICDRQLPLRARLLDFYESYSQAIFNRRWMRIFFFAGLRGLDINTRYIGRVGELIIKPICGELRHEIGLSRDMPITDAEMELAWIMHGTMFYQGIREHIYCTARSVDYSLTATCAVDMYLTTAPPIVREIVEKASR